MYKLFTLLTGFLCLNICMAQTTITLQPIQDAYVHDFDPTENLGSHTDFAAISWTNGGIPALARGLMEFDLSTIPAGSTIHYATLSLYHNPTSPNGVGHSTLSGPNDSKLYRITSAWNENSVNWNTQPAYSSQNPVSVASSSIDTEDYPNIDVTLLIQDMVNSPGSSHGFLFKLDDESQFRKLVFASSDHADTSRHPVLEISYTPSNLICNTMQPNAADGMDAYIHDYDPNEILGHHPDFAGISWTVGGTPALARGLLNFNLTGIPANANIVSATLSLYHNPTSPNGVGHSTMSGPNTSTLYRITSTWIENSVTWNNQPSYSLQNSVQLQASGTSVDDYPVIDVTALVQDMINDPSNSFGFLLKLDDESALRKLVFASSDHTDSTRHPKLEVCYENTIGIEETGIVVSNLIVYPNPASDLIHIDYSISTSEKLTWSLTDVQGKRVFTTTSKAQPGRNSFYIDRSKMNLASGMYMLQVSTGSNSINKKIVID